MHATHAIRITRRHTAVAVGDPSSVTSYRAPVHSRNECRVLSHWSPALPYTYTRRPFQITLSTTEIERRIILQIITGPPNGTVLFRSLASVVVVIVCRGL